MYSSFLMKSNHVTFLSFSPKISQKGEVPPTRKQGENVSLYVSRNEKMREHAQKQQCRQTKDADSPKC